jgi:hypothetical protein
MAFDRADTGVPDFDAPVSALSSFIESGMRLRHKLLAENAAYGFLNLPRTIKRDTRVRPVGHAMRRHR